MSDPATAEVTPALVKVTVPVVPPPLIPTPAVTPVISPCGAAAIRLATVIDLFVVVLRS
jgi:hypothetical protein